MLVTPADLTGFISIAIPPEIQTRARAYLQDSQGKPRAVRHLEEAAEQGGAPAHLVGLACARYELADLLAVPAHCIPEHGPRRRRVAVTAHRRIVRLQLRQPALEDEPMHPAHEPQRQRRPLGLGFESGQRVADAAA